MEHTTELDRLVRYVIGECSADERVEIERWIAADAARAKLVGELRSIWVTAEPVSAKSASLGWDTTSAWAEVSRQLDSTPRLDSPPRRAFAVRTIWRIAAAVLLVAGFSWAYRAGAGRWISAVRSTSNGIAAGREYVTHPGERAEFRLGDGTRVVLGVASRLLVPAEYGVTRRDVRLEGQAYFEVKHDGARPFAVRTAGGVVEDLGTRFDVLAYQSDTVVQVAVAEGRVALGDTARRGIVLVAGQFGQLRPDGTAIVRRDVDPSRQLAWVDGRLMLDSVPLRDALPRLSRWYDLEFRIADSALGALPLTATFPAQANSEVLDLLKLTLGVRQERSGRVITLYAK